MDFQASMEEVDEVTRRFQVSIPSSDIQKEFDRELQKVTLNANIKGFRKGKAPKDVILRLHGPRLKAEVAERLIQKSLHEIIEKHKLDMVGRPAVEIGVLNPEERIEYKADISLFPSPQIEHYEKFKVEIEARSVEDKDVEEALDRIRESQATLQPVKDRSEIQDRDVVRGQVLVHIPGEENQSTETLQAQIGSGELFPELEQALIGRKIGEPISLEKGFPEDDQNTRLSGKTVAYQITVDEISQKILPEVDDQFAKRLGMGVETALELRQKLRERIEQGLAQKRDEDVQVKVLEQLLEKNEFIVPQVMIDEEIKTLLIRQGALDPKKIDPQQFNVEPFRELLGEAAGRRVRSAIVIDRILQQEKIELSDEEYDAAITQSASQAGIGPVEYQSFLRSRQLEASFRLEQLRTKVLAFLAERATVKEVEASTETSESEEKKSKGSTKKKKTAAKKESSSKSKEAKSK